jgi:hypothetical protein
MEIVIFQVALQVHDLRHFLNSRGGFYTYFLMQQIGKG